jgi:PAS domain S-box-containing protein
LSFDSFASGLAKALSVDRKQFNMFFERMIDGFAYHKIVVDKAGKPVDYVFLEVNNAFETMTGLKKEKIMGKRVTEVIPGIEKDHANWIGVYGKVALTGEPTQFENYAAPLDKWYHVSAYSPEKGYFVALFEDITERKKAENALAKKQEELQTIIDSSQGWIFYKDCDNRFIRVNRAFAEVMGLPKEKLEPRSLFELYPREQAEAFWKDDKEVISSGKSKLGIIETMESKQGLRWVQTDKIPYRDAEGNIIGIIGFSIDITERRKAEEALRLSEERFRLALRNAPVSVAAQDSDLRYIWAYNQWTARPDQIIGKLDSEIFTPQEAAHMGEIKSRIMKENVEYSEQMWLDRPSGRIFIDVFFEPLHDKDGRVIGVGTATVDLTNIKLTEEALQKLNDELEERVEQRTAEVSDERHRLYNVLETLPAYVILLDKDHRVPFANKVFRETFGESHGRRCHEYLFSRDSECDNCITYKVYKENRPQHWYWTGPNGRDYDIYDFPFKETDGSTLILEMGIDITERKHAETELKKYQEHLEDLVKERTTQLWQAKNDWERTFDSVPDFIAVLDNQHNIVRANKAFAKQLGVTPDQAIGLKCYNCVHGTGLPPEFCPHAKTVIDGKEHMAEVHEPRLGGDFLVSTTPLLNEKGKMIGSVHVARNITERKQAENTLRALNRHLRAVSNSNQALMHAADEAKYTQEVCDIIVNDCGYALAWVGLAENDKAKTVRPAASAGADTTYTKNLKITWDAKSPLGRGPTGTAIRTGKPYLCKNMQTDPAFEPWRERAGQRGYTASCALPLVDVDGKIFGALNIYSKESNPFTDEEFKLLSELASDFAYGVTMMRLRKEKEQSEATVRKQASLIDLSPDAIMMRKLNGEITFWSAGAEKLYGWNKKEALGQSTHELLKTKFPDSMDEIIRELTARGTWQGELLHETKDGRTIVVQSYWLAQRGVDGKIAELLESNVDVTDRKQMQNKLEEYAAHLEELVEERTQQLKNAERLTAIGETAGMVGHDLRNPLQTVTGETFLAKDELKGIPDSEAKTNLAESIGIIAEQISYMDKIVSDLQDFVRPVNPDKKPLDLKQLLTATLLQVSIPDNIDVQTKIDRKLPEVLADGQLLKRVFFNLFTNAVQAMPEGGKLMVKAQVKKTDKENPELIITVSDTGVGIPENVKQKIFRPLFTTKSKGQGFGLAVCRRVVEAHGGSITFESREGKGTQFTVALPA